MKRLSGVLMGALLAFASAGIAGAGAGPGTKPVAANIFGTVADGSSNSDPSNGNACNVTSWVDECPSGSCECATLASPRISNSKLTVANVFFYHRQGSESRHAVSGQQRTEPKLQPGIGHRKHHRQG